MLLMAPDVNGTKCAQNNSSNVVDQSINRLKDWHDKTTYVSNTRL
jgi:hypothetical protein